MAFFVQTYTHVVFTQHITIWNVERTKWNWFKCLGTLMQNFKKRMLDGSTSNKRKSFRVKENFQLFCEFILLNLSLTPFGAETSVELKVKWNYRNGKKCNKFANKFFFPFTLKALVEHAIVHGKNSHLSYATGAL